MQSRNVRERLDGDEPLQDIPECPSQEALLSQHEDMLQEMQTSQDRQQGQPTEPHKLPVPPETLKPSSQERSHETCENKTNLSSGSASPGSPSGHGSLATDKLDSKYRQAASQDAAESPSQIPASVEQRSEHGQHLSQAAKPPNESRQADPALLAASEQQLSTAVCVQEQEHATTVAVHAPAATAAAAACLGMGASGVLAIDDSDDLEFELAQQMEDAANAAKSSQHAQPAAHAQLHPGSKSQGVQPPGVMQTEQSVPHQATQKPDTQLTIPMASSAEPDCHQAGPAGGKESAAAAADAVAPQQGRGQFNTFNSSNAFQDNDMEIDDDLAQLLDAASALRPAGQPDTALAGPGPASTSFSRSNLSCSCLRSAGSHPGLSGSRPNPPATFHQAVPTHDAHLPQQADGPLDPPIQANQILPKSRHQPGGITSPARESEDGVLALEPAGPADLAEQSVSISFHNI